MKSRVNIIPISPSSQFDLDAVRSGLALLLEHGFNSREPRLSVDATLRYLCGNDQSRLSELEAALFSDSQNILWATRGGYGLTRILPKLKLPERAMPTLVGFSDISSLHLHLWKHRQAKGIHGPMLGNLIKEDDTSLQSLWNILNGASQKTRWPALKPLHWPTDDVIEGTLIVTNLCILTHLIGTSSLPSLNGTILVLEDVAEPPYRLDRMLTQLWHSQTLQGVQAIVLGHFSSCGDSSLGVEAAILERCKTFGIPVCSGLPIGHESPNWSIGFGVHARLTKDTDISLQILEEVL